MALNGATVSSCRPANSPHMQRTGTRQRQASAAGVSGAAAQRGTKRRGFTILAGMESDAAGVIWFCFGTLRKTSSLRGRSRQHESRACRGLARWRRGPRQLEVTACRLLPPQPPPLSACRLVTPDAICNIASLRNQSDFNPFEGGLAFPPACLF